MPKVRYLSVCLPIPVRTAFTYAVPTGLEDAFVPGRRVRVPFANRTAVGWSAGEAPPPEPADDGRPFEAKPIAGLADDGPLLDEELVGLSRWIADTYACSWGEAMSACVPGGVRAEKADATVSRVRLAVPPDEALALAASLIDKHPKRARVLRILAEHDDGLALRDLVRAAQCGESPVRTLEKAGRLTIEQILSCEPSLNDQVGALYVDRSLEHPEPVKQERAGACLPECAIAHGFEPSRVNRMRVWFHIEFLIGNKFRAAASNDGSATIA